MRGFTFFVRNFASLLSFLLPFLEKFPSKLLPSQLEKLLSSFARTGRDLQRYDDKGYRQVVGCIPYRCKESTGSPSSIEDIEVLLISAMKGGGMLFPKGGWERDEKEMKDAAMRETLEEAGVIGEIECKLGKWEYMSKRGGIMHEGHMFSLKFEKQFDVWPEKSSRERRWVSVDEARELCKQAWMREALEAFVLRQTHQLQQKL